MAKRARRQREAANRTTYSKCASYESRTRPDVVFEYATFIGARRGIVRERPFGALPDAGRLGGHHV